MQKNSTKGADYADPDDALQGETGLVVSYFADNYRKAISEFKAARDRNGPREGYKAITNYERQTDRLVRYEELWLVAALKDRAYAREALGTRGLDSINKIRLLAALEIFKKFRPSYAQAATILSEICPEIEKHYSIVQLRKDFKRRVSKDGDFVSVAWEFACEEIEKCKDDQATLWALAVTFLAGIKLPL